MSYRPGDSKREEFRKYLEKAGLLDTLTKALVNLYHENDKPPDAIQYLKDYLGLNQDSSAENQEIEELKKEIASLRLENDHLKEKLSQHEQEKTEAPSEKNE